MSLKTSMSGLGKLERFATGFRADYRFGPVNIMVLVAIALIGLGIHLAVYPFRLEVVIAIVVTASNDVAPRMVGMRSPFSPFIISAPVSRGEARA